MPGLGIHDTHVMTADTVMCDETYLYIVMPFCRGGDLCQMVAESERFSEEQSRFWFRQILRVVLFAFYFAHSFQQIDYPLPCIFSIDLGSRNTAEG